MKNQVLQQLSFKKATVSSLENMYEGFQQIAKGSSTPLYCHSDLCLKN